MKLAVVSGFYPPLLAAESDYCYRLCERFAHLGWDIDLVTSQMESPAPPAGFRVHPVMKSWSWREAPLLLRTIRATGADACLLLYIGWNYRNQSMVTFLPTLLSYALPGTKLATLFYNRYGADRKTAPLHQVGLYKLFKTITREPDLVFEWGSLLTRSDRIIALCEDHAKTFRTLYPPCAAKTDVLPPPPLIPIAEGGRARHRDGARTSLGLAPDEEAIVFFGFLYGPKGIPTLLRAFAKLARPRAKLFLIGGSLDPRAPHASDYADELRALAGDLGIAQRLHFTGAFDYDSLEPSRLLTAADVFCLPFDRGVALNNSSFASVTWHEAPIVSTSGPYTEAAFRDRDNVLFAPPEDPDALARALDEVLNDRMLAEKLREGARRLARSHFSWENVLQGIENALAKGS